VEAVEERPEELVARLVEVVEGEEAARDLEGGRAAQEDGAEHGGLGGAVVRGRAGIGGLRAHLGAEGLCGSVPHDSLAFGWGGSWSVLRTRAGILGGRHWPSCFFREPRG